MTALDKQAYTFYDYFALLYRIAAEISVTHTILNIGVFPDVKIFIILLHTPG